MCEARAIRSLGWSSGDGWACRTSRFCSTTLTLLRRTSNAAWDYYHHNAGEIEMAIKDDRGRLDDGRLYIDEGLQLSDR